MKYKLLLQALREGIIEREHYGIIALIDNNNNVLKELGDIRKTPFYTRSCHKPFQAFPLITSGTYRKYNFSTEELAVCLASHSGNLLHTKIIKNILNKIGLNESHLQCGIHPPIDEQTKTDLLMQGLEPNVLHNNCSGKHVGMLAVCMNNDWDIDKYLDINHPLQQEILKITKKYCGTKNFKISVDGCGTPIPAMPLYNLAMGYQSLFSGEEGILLRQAFLKHPKLIGGNNRLDTEIIEASEGKLVAKIGAEGLCAIVNIKLQQTLIIKIIDANMQARKVVAFEALKQLNWLKEKQINRYYDLSVKTLNNEIVGNLKATLF